MSISLDEQETTISIYPSKVQKTAEVYTCEPSVVRHINKLAGQYPGEVELRASGENVFASLPRSWVRIQPPRRLNLTPEQRLERAERLKKTKEGKS